MSGASARFTLFAIGSFNFYSLTVTHVAHWRNLLQDAVEMWLSDEDGGEKVIDFTRNDHDGKFWGKPDASLIRRSHVKGRWGKRKFIQPSMNEDTGKQSRTWIPRVKPRLTL